MNSRIAYNCRACMEFKRWFTVSKPEKKTHEKPSSSKDEVDDHNDCPLDTRELGVATWKLLHSIAAYFPDNPTETEKAEIVCLFQMIAKYYPCTMCSRDFQLELSDMPPETESGERLSIWLCKIHNRVNKKLGKPLYDCSRVMERWRDGWKDGSCD